MSAEKHQDTTVNVRLRFREFTIPPVSDALVIGAKAAIGGEAMLRALKLLHVAPFDRIELTSEEGNSLISDVLIREGILNKVPRDRLIQLVQRRVMPFVTAEEIVHVEIETEVITEDVV